MKNILETFALIMGLVVISSMNISCTDEPKAKGMPIEKTSMNDVSSKDAASFMNNAVTLAGKVVETMDAGGYTYINIEKDGKSTWLALPLTQVKVGQELSFRPGMVMNNFSSKTLDRNFESIVFSAGLIGGSGMNTKGPLLEAKPSGNLHGVPAPAAEGEAIKVEKADGANAYTVAELYEKSGELDTKSIVLKGKVVKVSQGIMNKNWIHIQDGSGSASDGTNNMIVTSQDVPSVGDVVTAKGTLHKDKDFGMGYFYAVIVEEGSIK